MVGLNPDRGQESRFQKYSMHRRFLGIIETNAEGQPLPGVGRAGLLHKTSDSQGLVLSKDIGYHGRIISCCGSRRWYSSSQPTTKP